jgi:hypothetical protein
LNCKGLPFSVAIRRRSDEAAPAFRSAAAKPSADDTSGVIQTVPGSAAIEGTDVACAEDPKLTRRSIDSL